MDGLSEDDVTVNIGEIKTPTPSQEKILLDENLFELTAAEKSAKSAQQNNSGTEQSFFLSELKSQIQTNAHTGTNASSSAVSTANFRPSLSADPNKSKRSRNRSSQKRNVTKKNAN